MSRYFWKKNFEKFVDWILKSKLCWCFDILILCYSKKYLKQKKMYILSWNFAVVETSANMSNCRFLLKKSKSLQFIEILQPLDEGAALFYFLQLRSAVEYCHNQVFFSFTRVLIDKGGLPPRLEIGKLITW